GIAPIEGWGTRVGIFCEATLSGLDIRARARPTELLQEFEFPCPRDGLRPARYLQLAVDRVYIPFHGAQRDHEPVRDLSIRATCCDQPQDLYLARAQWFDQRVRTAPWCDGCGRVEVRTRRRAQQ